MLTFDQICNLISEHFELDSDSPNYSVKFIFEDEFEYNYALIEWHIIDRKTKKDFGPTFAIISNVGNIIECPCDIFTSDYSYRKEVVKQLENLRTSVEAEEREWNENQAMWDEELNRDANRQFNDMMNEFDAWGNID